MSDADRVDLGPRPLHDPTVSAAALCEVLAAAPPDAGDVHVLHTGLHPHVVAAVTRQPSRRPASCGPTPSTTSSSAWSVPTGCGCRPSTRCASRATSASWSRRRTSRRWAPSPAAFAWSPGVAAADAGLDRRRRREPQPGVPDGRQPGGRGDGPAAGPGARRVGARQDAVACARARAVPPRRRGRPAGRRHDVPVRRAGAGAVPTTRRPAAGGRARSRPAPRGPHVRGGRRLRDGARDPPARGPVARRALHERHVLELARRAPGPQRVRRREQHPPAALRQPPVRDQGRGRGGRDRLGAARLRAGRGARAPRAALRT